jgi:hypothetical protein
LEGSILTVKENTEALVVVTKEFGLEVNADKTKYVVMSLFTALFFTYHHLTHFTNHFTEIFLHCTFLHLSSPNSLHTSLY